MRTPNSMWVVLAPHDAKEMAVVVKNRLTSKWVARSTKTLLSVIKVRNIEQHPSC